MSEHRFAGRAIAPPAGRLPTRPGVASATFADILLIIKQLGPKAAVQAHRIAHTLWNDLDRVATLRAEYRDVGKAGVFALARSDLLVATCGASRLAGAQSSCRSVQPPCFCAAAGTVRLSPRHGSADPL